MTISISSYYFYTSPPLFFPTPFTLTFRKVAVLTSLHLLVPGLNGLGRVYEYRTAQQQVRTRFIHPSICPSVRPARTNNLVSLLGWGTIVGGETTAAFLLFSPSPAWLAGRVGEACESDGLAD